LERGNGFKYRLTGDFSAQRRVNRRTDYQIVSRSQYGVMSIAISESQELQFFDNGIKKM